MKVAINIDPLKTDYRIQGTGVYIDNLITNLKSLNQKNEYISFSRTKRLPKKVDLVHYPYFNPFFITLPLIKSLPTVVTVHDLMPIVFPEHFPAGIRGQLRWRVQKWSLRGASGVIVDSNATKRDVIQYTGIPDTKVYVVYLAGRDTFRQIKSTLLLDSIRVKYGLPEKFVLYVGDILWTKNIPNLIGAIKEINVTLVMVGKQTNLADFDKSNPWNKDLVFLNEETKDDKRILRLGFIPSEDLVVIYNLATLFIMPSFYEGFGLPVLEAMSCGTPIITTRCGSIPEVAGEAAFYIDPNDVESIANGVGEIFFNKKLQEELSRKGLNQAKKFTWRKTARDTIKVYKQSL